MCKVCAAVGLGLVVAGIAFAAPVKAADCSADVTAAFEKQRKGKGYRTTSLDQSPQGLVSVQIDYVAPDRMHQTVRHPNHSEPIETIAIGRWAWATMGGGWEELQPQFAQSVTAHVREALVAPLPEVKGFSCLGKVSFEGKEFVAYRTSQQPPPATPPDRGPGAQPAAETGAPPASALARTVYVDTATGLPMFNVVADAKPGSEPVFKAAFSYPADIKIDAPIGEAK